MNLAWSQLLIPHFFGTCHVLTAKPFEKYDKNISSCKSRSLVGIVTATGCQPIIKKRTAGEKELSG
jgi:hypothetical protein